MSDTSKDRRRYSDREMALILKRAATLQEQGPDAASQDQSHTLTELERVAVEVGIDPRYVAEAAAAVDAEPTAKKAPLLGAPTSYQVARIIEGEVPETEFGELLDAIRLVTGRHGEVSRVLGAFEWKSSGPSGETYVAIAPRRGKTSIRLGGRYGAGAGFVYSVTGVIGAALLVGTSVSTGSPIDLGTLAAVAGGSYLAARTAWQVLAGKTERRLRKILEEVTLTVVRVARTERENDE
jgi:hypothetical protein